MPKTLMTSNNFGAIRLSLKHAKRKLTDLMADEIVEVARANARVDTGHYRDNIRAMHGGTPGSNEVTELRHSSRTGRMVKRRAVAVTGVRVDESAVVAAAAHSFIVERWDSNIFRATESVSGPFEEIVGRVRKDFNLG